MWKLNVPFLLAERVVWVQHGLPAKRQSRRTIGRFFIPRLFSAGRCGEEMEYVAFSMTTLRARILWLHQWIRA